MFSTRSPDRPNPIGVHRVTVVAVDGCSVRVRDLEAIDGTPIVDVKPVLRSARALSRDGELAPALSAPPLGATAGEL